jgi:ankyrin repeat protein
MNDVQYYPIELFHWSGMQDSNINMVEDILEAHPEYVHEQNAHGDNCLIIAIKSGNIQIVKYIIENTDIDINYTTKEGSALLESVKKGNVQMLDYLLSHKSIDLYAKNGKGENVYHIAAQSGNADLIEKLLEIDKTRMIGEVDNLGRHCLFSLIETYPLHKDYWCFEVILEALTDEELWKKDTNNLNILDFIESRKKGLEGSYTVDRTKLHAPLVNVLNSRTLKTQLENSLQINEGSRDSGKIKV